MARASITKQRPVGAGATVAFTAMVAGSGNGVAVDLDTDDIVLLRNTTASPITVTVLSTAQVDGLSLPNRTYAVPAAVGGASGLMVAGNLTLGAYEQADGFVYIETATALDIAVLSLS